VFAQEQPNGDQTSATKQDVSVSAPDLADIIPKAAELSGRLAILENRVRDVRDVSEIEKKFARIEESLKGPAARLLQIKDSKNVRVKKLVELRKIIEQENELFEEISRPLSEAIRQFGAWRNDWQAEQQRWNEWQTILLEDGDFAQLKSTFEKAKDTIDKALEIVLSQLNSMLAVQERAGNIQAKIIALITEFDSLILAALSGVRVHISPPMFSSRYLSQFSNELWYALQKGLDEISWPDSDFFDRQGLIVFLLSFSSLFLIIAIYRNRQVLNDSKRWRFLAARPFSAGLFFGSIILMLFYEYWRIRDASVLGLVIVAGISFARLIGGMNPASWKRQFVYGLIIVLIVTRLLYVIMLPLPLFRIYTVLTASVGLFFCLRWARESARQKESGFYRWPLRLGAFFFAFIVIAEIWGKQGFAEYLFISLIRSTATLLGFMMFIYMIRGFIEWIFLKSSLQQTALFSRNTDAIILRATLFTDVAICGLVFLPGILFIWGAYDSLPEAMKGLLALGFNLGSQRISVGLVIISAGILYVSFLASWIVRKLLMDEVLAKQRVEKGVRVSIARLVHYVLIFIGFLAALFALGFEFTKLTIMLSALGVGIGFGLQSVVNNFVSGLILLFERPVRVGDFIELGGKWAEIKNIGLRATTVQTLDQADVIIPNADLVANQVINWTLSNRRVRLIIPVGVAYGSDISLVMETLMTCAIELRVWVPNAEERLTVISELHQEIDRRFREAKIEIAFPQRDLHLRGVDESVILQPTGSEK
jgi:small-conductance mechanosensitive channel